jgi:F-type H+-transporting ATPase subunit delta
MSEADDKTTDDHQPDIGNERIGDVYARALLGAAQHANVAAAALNDLDAIIGELFANSPKLEAIVASPMVSPEEKLGLLDRLLAGRVTPVLLNFLKVVARRGRLDCLRAIGQRARFLYEEMQGQVRVQVITATAIEPSELAVMAKNLAATLGRTPILETVVDPQLIGGAVLRIADTVYDGSVANQLQSFRQRLIDRSVHEIQSRRDSFCYPTGS